MSLTICRVGQRLFNHGNSGCPTVFGGLQAPHLAETRRGMYLFAPQAMVTHARKMEMIHVSSINHLSEAKSPNVSRQVHNQPSYLPAIYSLSTDYTNKINTRQVFSDNLPISNNSYSQSLLNNSSTCDMTNVDSHPLVNNLPETKPLITVPILEASTFSGRPGRRRQVEAFKVRSSEWYPLVI